MRNWLKNSIDWFFDKSNFALAFLGGAFSIIDISGLDNWTIGESNFPMGKILYWCSCILFIISCLFSFFYGKEINQLEKELIIKGNKINDLENKLTEEVSNSNDLFNSYLRLLVKNLSFEHTERISVYKVYDDKFKLIGRTSVNPILMEKGRNEYPIKEGFIGIGWQQGEYFIKDLPDPSLKKGENYYNAIKKVCNIDKEIVDNMKMKSRNFFIYRINGYEGKPKAVLVFESTLPNKFEKEFIIERLAGVKQPLIMFIEKNNGVISIENNIGI
ncbi:hypothetical protein ACF3OB_03020 [Capnocytophaga canis]|uniref:hypothetical protein n=1 Tax=Capnocytophaga canis TaxID=1848903 RepID=UPI00370D8116